MRSKKFSLSAFPHIPVHAEQFPLPFIQRHHILIVNRTEDTLTVGVLEYPHKNLIEDIENTYQKIIEFVKIDRLELISYLNKYYTVSLHQEETFKSASSSASSNLTSIDNQEYSTVDTVSQDAPILNLVNTILLEAIEQSITDIHIEIIDEQTTIRYRKDGHLVVVRKYPLQYYANISARLKVMTNLDIMETRLPQDGRATVSIGDKKQDLRISILPVYTGESIVIRILQERDYTDSLEDLGFSSSSVSVIQSILKYRQGLFLVTGPTGSGKTTSLHTILRKIKEDSDKVITLEDPIEYVFRSVSQIQVQDRIGLSFDTLLRRVLRHDPDIIMVGEIRDHNTASLVARAALTGHLVFSTLHTDSASAVITRLHDIGLPSYVIAAVLRGIISQRLVRKICQHCSSKKDTRKHKSLQEAAKSNKICTYCKGTKFYGRLLLEEVMEVDSTIKNFIAEEKINNILSYLEKKKHKSLVMDARQKIRKKLTTVEEVCKQMDFRS